MKLIPRRLLVAIAALLVLAYAGLARAQVLDQVPSSALVVVKVKDLGGTSTKVAKFATDLGVAQMAPPLADPLGALMQKLNIKDGMDKSGDMAFVYMDPATVTDAPDQKSFMLLIPVTDYKAFLGNFADAKTEGDVSTLTLPNDPSPSYMVNWGNYAVLSPSKTLVSAKPVATLKPSAASVDELAHKDLVVFANLAVWRAKLRPELAKNKDTITQLFDSQFKERPQAAKYLPILDAFFGQIFSAADAYLRDADGATLSVNLGTEGVSIAVQSDFQPDSYSGKIVAQFKNSNDSLLTGLPDGKYIVAGGLVLDPAVSSKLFTDFLDPIQQAATQGGDDLKDINEAMTAFKTAFAAIDGETVGILTPNIAQPGQESLIQVLAVVRGDAETIKTQSEKAQVAQQAFMQNLGMPGMEGIKQTLTPNAKTVDGVSFDSLATTFDPAATSPAAQQQAKMMQMIYGPQGAVAYNGVLDPKHMLMAMGVSDATISSLIAAAKAGQSPVADNAGVKSVATNLPTSRAAAFYTNLGDLVGTVLGYAKQMGFPVPVQLPPDLPPVGTTISTQQSTLRYESYVPTSLIQGLVAAGMQAYMQTQGGGGGGL